MPDMVRNMHKTMISFGLLCAVSMGAFAQRQLLLMKGDRLIERFRVGDNIHTKLTGQSQEHWGFILAINEFNMITSQDTIELNEIRKVLAEGRPLINSVGKTMILIGAAYFVIDQFNEIVVVKNDPSMNSGVWKPSAVLIGAGLPMLLFKKNWKRVPGKFKLISVGRDSRLYLPVE